MRFKLNVAHYINDVLYEAGTVLGEGVIPFPDNWVPTYDSTPIDDEAKKAWDKVWKDYKPPFGPDLVLGPGVQLQPATGPK